MERFFGPQDACYFGGSVGRSVRWAARTKLFCQKVLQPVRSKRLPLLLDFRRIRGPQPASGRGSLEARSNL